MFLERASPLSRAAQVTPQPSLPQETPALLSWLQPEKNTAHLLNERWLFFFLIWQFKAINVIYSGVLLSQHSREGGSGEMNIPGYINVNLLTA